MVRFGHFEPLFGVTDYGKEVTRPLKAKKLSRTGLLAPRDSRSGPIGAHRPAGYPFASLPRQASNAHAGQRNTSHGDTARHYRPRYGSNATRPGRACA